ncbi:MAG: SBBP repeat-containing protein [Acidimicrobiales bacterium]
MAITKRSPHRLGSEQRGFTLIELLVVVVILGILSAVVVVALRGTNDKGKGAAVATDARTIRTAQEAYCAQAGQYARTMDQLVGAAPAESDGKTYKLLSEPSEYHALRDPPQNPTGSCNGMRYEIICKDGSPMPNCGGPVPGPQLPSCPSFNEAPGPTVPTVPLPKAAPPGVALGAGPPRFAANAGQLDPEVKFSSRGPDYSLFLTPDEMVMSLSHGKGTPADVVRMRLVGANANPEVVGEDRASSRSSYFTARDPSRWVSDVPDYQRVVYRQVYPGIDLVWHGQGGRLEYDFVVAPGADPSVIAESFTGVDRLAVDERGAMALTTAGGTMAHGQPSVYQDQADGTRRPVHGSYRLDGDQAGFDIGSYDTTRPLVIDPVVLSYATYMQPARGGDDEANAVATDAAGSTYFTGSTASLLFPTQNAAQPTPGNGYVYIVVVKFDAVGQLVFSTYLGGNLPGGLPVSDISEGLGIAVDQSGNVIVVGSTPTPDYPVVPPGNTYQSGISGGGGHAFLTKLNPTGSLIVSSSLLGGRAEEIGSGYTGGNAVAVRGSTVYVSGTTSEPTFWTLPQQADGPPANEDAFVARFDEPDGPLKLTGALTLTYSARFGDPPPQLPDPPDAGSDEGQGVAVDGSGNAYVLGMTTSIDFPVTNMTTRQGASDFFVAKFNPDGQRIWSTYLGGAGDEGGAFRHDTGGIAVDGAGNAYVAGTTTSNDFPAAKTPRPGGVTDAFLAKLGPDGSLLRSTYIGGTGDDYGFSVTVDGADRVYLGGSTTSAAVVDSGVLVQDVQSKRGGLDGYIVKFDGSGGPEWVTYLGGSLDEQLFGVASDPAGNLAVAGATTSSDLPTTKNAFQQKRRGRTGGAFPIHAIFAARLVTCP